MLPLLLASALLLQNPAPKPPPLPGAKETPVPAAAPESKLLPGVLPEGTSAEARELWQRFCAATLAPKATRVPLTGFDLVLDAQIRNASNQSNENLTPLRYRFQLPDLVRATTEHQKELLHGPKGDFVLDPAHKDKQPLAVGREGEEDRKQLAEIQDVSRNFLALSDPSALRIAGLKLGSADPALLPAPQGLVWLEILTPDFRMPGSAPVGMLKVQLGIRRDKGLPEWCLVGTAEPGARPATLIRVQGYREKQGLVVPHDLALFPFDKQSGRFPEQPPLHLWLKNDSDLRPQFAPETFWP
jgi:hypothetical protein